MFYVRRSLPLSTGTIHKFQLFSLLQLQTQVHFKSSSVAGVGTTTATTTSTVNETNSSLHSHSFKNNDDVMEPTSTAHYQLDNDLIRHLERTSLVDFESEEALIRLKESIKFADTLLAIDTSGVEPMASVLENIPLRLREDKGIKTNRKDILYNASLTEEDYFVSPPGNIPLEQKTKSFTKVSDSSIAHNKN